MPDITTQPAPGRWSRAAAVAAACGLLAFLLTGIVPLVTPDSAAYLSTAESLSNGKGFVSYDGEPYVNWPPGYPVLLAALSLGMRPSDFAAPLINGLSVFGICLLASSLLRGTGPRLRLAGAALASLSPLTLNYSRAMLSDCLFAVFAVAAIAGAASVVERYYHKFDRHEFHYNSPSRWWLWAMLVGLCGASLTRLAGAAIAAACAVTVGFLVYMRGRTTLSSRYGLRYAAVAIAGAIPAGLWMLMNKLQHGTSTTAVVRHTPFIEQLWGAVAGTGAGFALGPVPFLAVLMFLFWNARRRHDIASTALLLATTGYILLIAALASIVALDGLANGRFFACIAPVLTVVAVKQIGATDA